MASVKIGINDGFTFNPGAWASFKIPQGAYNVTDLNKTIKELIKKNAGAADNFELTPNYNTLRARITLQNNLIIEISPATSIASVLGFKNQQYGSFVEQTVSYDGGVPVNITQVSTILINYSIASGSYLAKGSQGQKIYSFSPDVPPGSLLQVTPRQIIYYPINLAYQITSITMQLTDQSGQQLDLNNDTSTNYLHLSAT